MSPSKDNEPDPEHVNDIRASGREFCDRHIGPRDSEIHGMLESLGLNSLDELIASTLPPSIQSDKPLALSSALSEVESLERLKSMAAENRVLHNMIGMGYHETILPSVIQRNVLENPGWYTAYTPYQAEISQGRLEALLNFQQMVSDLTGMALANASLLDEATAAAEAMTMMQRVNRKAKSRRFLIDHSVFPQTLDVLRTRARHMHIEIVLGNASEQVGSGDFFGVLLQYPAADGQVYDPREMIAVAHERGALVTVATDLLSTVLLTPPGEMGADVVVGSAQRLGVPMGFGGPHAAFLATRDDYKRSLPGRVIGVSKDRHGRTALRMALQTREQHIRRDKATSNICTAQALLAVISGFYASYHGAEGLREIALQIHRLCSTLAQGLKSLGHAPRNEYWFDTLSITLDAEQAAKVFAAAEAGGVNLWRQGGLIRISINERSTSEHIKIILHAFSQLENLPHTADAAPIPGDWRAIPDELHRQSPFLQHPVFSSYHSETSMLRYLKRLENKDLSLTHAMISLGSCTMKLNATTEMIPITWPEFCDIHPFAPAHQTKGYQALIKELEKMLIACTGYDAVSLQPNAGSQGEYAGLLAIKSFHESNQEPERNVCLIPSSAHGTNPASAAMCGMKIMLVRCDEKGNVDLEDLTRQAEAHSNQLAALMITYPSTHGVFEEDIREICEVIHKHGGQVYLDGANLNALVGCAAPGRFGADVSHLNLHKTFCIPHGGGGPGVGPICVGSHLEPHLPGHSLITLDGPSGANAAVAAAPWGSAGILPISWAYITMMGAHGMRKATQVAILSANYIAKRLSAAYEVLYTGRNDRVAHECIIDLRPFKDSCGITEEDVAKRLIDYGFHSPTMSFPVPGTLMIEPTESEPLEEIDRFCDAMLAIRKEIRQLEDGHWDPEDNPLTNAPHTAFDMVNDWPHRYKRSQAAYPAGMNPGHSKYWPPVSRVDNVFGDRNLVCACPPVEDWITD